jgi:replicative DNA helicase Mcm
LSEAWEEVFQDFLRASPKYREKLARLSATESRSLIVDYDDLWMFNKDWAEQLLRNPHELLIYACRATTKQLKVEDPEYAERIKEVKTRFRNLPQEVPLRSIGAEQLNKLIAVSGIVVRSTTVRPLLVKGVFKCRRCGARTPPVDQAGFTIQSPVQCPSCKRASSFELLTQESTWIDSQDIRIQERPEDLLPGQLPRHIDVKVTDDLVDVARPGDGVSVTGIIKPSREMEFGFPRRERARAVDLYIEGNYVDTLEREVELEISPDEEEKIREMAKDPFIHRKIMSSIAPSIFGHETVKEAAMYMLFGGCQKALPDGATLRGDLHILLIGDPGTAKSQLLQYVAHLSPRGLYTTGRGTTAAGLTAAVVRERHGGLVLEAGALVLADKGVCCVDEIDKMRPEDRVAIHEAMEQQTVSISKGGIVATLNARAAILAAANPTLGRYDPYRTVAENISALPITILSRFDLIFVMRDEPQRDTDRDMADHILTLHKTGTTTIEPPLDPLLLRKYISYAKRLEPRLSDEAKKRIQEFYLRMRTTEARESPIAITPRQLESLVRLAEARARAALREEVTAEDAEASINLMRKSLEQVGIDVEGRYDIDIIMTGKPKALRDKLGQALSIITELEKEEGMAPLESVYEKLAEQGIERIEADRLINQLTRDGAIYSPKSGYVKKV